MMRLDGLVRLVESLSPSQLGEASLLYLRLRGYPNPEFSDGTGDGGRDLRILNLGGQPSRVVVQISVEKRWQSKLRQDVAKAATNYSPSTFIYISSRRLPELEYQKVHDSLVKQFKFQIERVDSQSLASAFFESGMSGHLLDIAGVEKQPSRIVNSRASFLTEAVYSYIFLSSEVRDFRDSVVERIVEGAIFDRPSRAAVARGFATSLATEFSGVDAAVFESCVDRLLQAGELVQVGSSITLSEGAQSRVDTTRRLDELSWQALQKRVTTQLIRFFGAVKATEVTPAIVALLGAAASGIGERIAGAFGKASTELEEQLRSRIRELDAVLENYGIALKSERAALVEKLIGIVSEEPAGKSLVAAEMFGILSRTGAEGVARAFGSSASLPVLVLDANVAMPVLLNSYLAPANSRFFKAASRLLDTATARELRLIMPRDYLEEAATHLIDAGRKYGSLVDLDPDLEFSRNVFVAHYSATRSRHKKNFFRYLASLGATPEVLARRFPDARRILMNELTDLFGRYGVDLEDFADPDAFALKGVESDLAYVAKNRNQKRSSLTEKHDARLIAQLESAGRSRDNYFLLVTWDRLMISFERKNLSLWCALDPASCADLLMMSSAEEAQHNGLLSASDIAKSMTEESAEKGAAVLDWLVRTHNDRLGDSDYREAALSWKKEYLKKSQDTRDSALSESWRRSGRTVASSTNSE